jgi:hypothetical protein
MGWRENSTAASGVGQGWVWLARAGVSPESSPKCPNAQGREQSTGGARNGLPQRRRTVKFQITMEDQDGVYDSIEDAVSNELNVLDIDDDELDALREVKREKLVKLLDAWFERGEILVVEVDTEAKTCVVVPRKDVT